MARHIVDTISRIYGELCSNYSEILYTYELETSMERWNVGDVIISIYAYHSKFVVLYIADQSKQS